MKFLIFFCALVVAVKAYKQNYFTKNQMKGLAATHGEIVFEGCHETTCYEDVYTGHNCKVGRCSYVCEPKGCFDNKAVEQVSSPNWSEHLQFSSRGDFFGCSSDSCNNGEYVGYGCVDGHCATVCKGSECHEEKDYGHYY